MSDDDKPPQLVRAIRAKRAGLATIGRIDGGAVALGLVIPLATFAPTIVDLIPPWLALGLLAVALVGGGFLTSYATAREAVCPACHGGLVGAAFVVIVAAVVGSTVLAGDAATDVAVVGMLGGSPGRALGFAVAAIVLGTLGGVLQRVGRRPTASGRNP